MRRYFVLPLIILVCHFGIGQATEAVDGQNEGDSMLSLNQSELIFEQSKTFPDKTEIAIAIIENGDTKFYGITRRNDTILPSNNHKRIFEIGSITKVFTCTLLANEVLDGKIELDDDISDYLDFPLKDSVEISFKQLANHTSGLPRLPTNLDLEIADPANPYRNYGEKELQEYLTQELELSQAPGEKSEYSNLGAGLLGYLLSKIANISYEDLLQKKIFAKYQMSHSSTYRNEVDSLLVSGLNEDGEEVPNWDMSVLMGAGGILSSVEDLAKFGTAQFDSTNQELELTRAINFTINEFVKLGLAWALIKRESGAEWYWHNGGTGGYTSTMILDIKTRNGVIILSNVSAYSKETGKISELGSGLMEMLSKQ